MTVTYINSTRLYLVECEKECCYEEAFYIVTHINILARVTISLHSFLSIAISVNPLLFIFLKSSSSSSCHIDLGLPLYLRLVGFHFIITFISLWFPAHNMPPLSYSLCLDITYYEYVFSSQLFQLSKIRFCSTINFCYFLVSTFCFHSLNCSLPSFSYLLSMSHL